MRQTTTVSYILRKGAGAATVKEPSLSTITTRSSSFSTLEEEKSDCCSFGELGSPNSSPGSSPLLPSKAKVTFTASRRPFMSQSSTGAADSRPKTDVMKKFFYLSIIGTGLVVFLNFNMLSGQHRSQTGHHASRSDYSLLGSEEFFAPQSQVSSAASTKGDALRKLDKTTLDQSGLRQKLQGHNGALPFSQLVKEQRLAKQQQQRQLETSSAALSATATTLTTTQETRRRAKVLMGIITADYPNDKSYRKRHRELFQLWDDKRTCSLPEFEKSFFEYHKEGNDGDGGQVYIDCELIYTFIIGANPDPNGPTELVSHNESYPLLVPKPVRASQDDVNDPDTSLLNIRENMNEGKSQTFLYYASLLMDKYGIDYAMKCDADAILHLHDYFYFAHRNLPPAPYNTNIYVGALRDKAYWPKHKPQDLPRFESYFGNEYEGVHLYIAGQCYIISHDLAAFIAKEALNSRGYVEGHEDHDISAMAFHSPDAVHLITIAKKQRFWEHPVKGEPRWRRIWKRESSRMSGIPFEGKKLRLY